LTFRGGNGEAIVLQTLKNHVEELSIRRPVVGEETDAIDIDFEFLDVAQDQFHDFLSDVGRLTDSHWAVVCKRRTSMIAFRMELST
jgi:hypothetical protein